MNCIWYIQLTSALLRKWVEKNNQCAIQKSWIFHALFRADIMRIEKVHTNLKGYILSTWDHN